MSEISTALDLLTKLGFPIWAGVVLWAAVKITHAVNFALADLRARDGLLQESMEKHIAQSDTRISLIEQLLQRHDRSIEQIWVRINEE